MDHYFEQLAKVKYRYHKKFTSNYIDELNKPSLIKEIEIKIPKSRIGIAINDRLKKAAN